MNIFKSKCPYETILNNTKYVFPNHEIPSPSAQKKSPQASKKNMVYIGIKSNNMKIQLYNCNIHAKI